MSVINPSTPADSRRANVPPAPGEPVTIDQYIADVLRRAHQTADTGGAPDEARAILHVAQLFADDLAEIDPRFDRLQFIDVITRAPARPASGTPQTKGMT